VRHGSKTRGSARSRRRKRASFSPSQPLDDAKSGAAATRLDLGDERSSVRAKGVNVHIGPVALVSHGAGKRNALGFDAEMAVKIDNLALDPHALDAGHTTHGRPPVAIFRAT